MRGFHRSQQPAEKTVFPDAFSVCRAYPAWCDVRKGAEVHEEGFNPDGLQLYIDPEECIDCGACEPECPVEAIYEESEVPVEWDGYIKKNYEWFGQEAPE